MIDMRIKQMKFREISMFLERSELDIASKYFDLVQFSGGLRPNPEPEYYPVRQSRTETRLHPIDVSQRESATMASLTFSVRSISLTARASQSFSSAGLRRLPPQSWRGNPLRSQAPKRVTIIIEFINSSREITVLEKAAVEEEMPSVLETQKEKRSNELPSDCCSLCGRES